MDNEGVPVKYWSYAVLHAVAIHNHTSSDTISKKVPYELVFGYTPDISAFYNFSFYQKVRYLNKSIKFPLNKELPGRFLGIAWDTGDLMTFRIMPDTPDKENPYILTRSIVEPDDGRNK